VTQDKRLVSERFPRSSRCLPEWLIASASGGANSLWLTEWLTTALDLQPGMRVLDLGCGRASSSIYLRREFGMQVWATDLWFSASENIQIRSCPCPRSTAEGLCYGARSITAPPTPDHMIHRAAAQHVGG
jgi:2-polyprenyl-3-methyl-5-hydroxy-6-metoxy-1,4-benzoquinol methylase